MARTRVRRSTKIYLVADLALKEQAVQKAPAIDGKDSRLRPDDELPTFLKNLYFVPIMTNRSKQEWPRLQASRGALKAFGVTPRVGGSDARNAVCGRILLRQLAAHFLAPTAILNPIAPVHSAKNGSVREFRDGGPRIDCGVKSISASESCGHARACRPDRWCTTDCRVVELGQCKGSDLGPPETATERHRQHPRGPEAPSWSCCQAC